MPLPFMPCLYRTADRPFLKTKKCLPAMFSPYQSNAANPELLPEKFHSAFLEKVHLIVESNYHNPHFGVDELSQAIPLSPSQLYRKIKALTGRSPATFLRKLRMQKSIGLLIHTDMTISEIAYQTGFSDPAYFSRVFTAEHKICPITYRRCKKNPSF